MLIYRNETLYHINPERIKQVPCIVLKYFFSLMHFSLATLKICDSQEIKYVISAYLGYLCNAAVYLLIAKKVL